MRCLVLGQELFLRGATVHFICRNHTGSAHALVGQAGHCLHLLPGKHISRKSAIYSDWLGYSQCEDSNACSQIISSLVDCHVIVDHYALDITWESRIVCASLTVIDDLADRRHQCARLIDQSLIHNKEDYESLIREPFEFLGGRSILLREEFRDTPEWQDLADGSLLVCMGGADPYGHTLIILEILVCWLKNTSGQSLLKKIDIVVGGAFEAHDVLKQCLAQVTLDVHVHQGHPNISRLMAQSSLSILSCGTMILEACALGAPTIGIPLAENQEATASFLEAHKAILLLKNDQDITHNLKRLLESTLGSPHVRAALSRHSKQRVDNNATSLIAAGFMRGS